MTDLKQKLNTAVENYNADKVVEMEHAVIGDGWKRNVHALSNTIMEHHEAHTNGNDVRMKQLEVDIDFHHRFLINTIEEAT